MKRLLIAAAIGFASLAAHAADIGISAKETYAKIQQAEQNVLFLDVRDPVEIMFVGSTDAAHANVPFMLVDRTQWNAERGVFRLYRNPDFINQVKLELARRGLSADAEIITLCRSGSERGKPSADFLRENGFPNARYVIHGFQGDAIKEGPQAGFRLQNGWQNSGLPWSPKMSPEKIHRVDRP
ncbi:rhodanese-like domain-containing protein [Thauera sp.]|uniref:rhodanese-like domain-containing protein n=1 Tax=Thauera sp. TaxID=1905334 RepID=UPI002B77CF47|nr:rhodanese-like domain-containing protein [Thauera sp.]HRP23323.1 sulfurtransferase [Thauera sp.]